MRDSDDEYVEDMSDDEIGGVRPTAGDVDHGTRSKGRSDRKVQGKKDKGSRKAAWEDIQRSWDAVVETEDGSIIVELLEAEKRRRLMRDTTPLQRGIIRHLILVVDMSFAMAEKDLLPNRYRLTLSYAVDFVREFFEQNPISQLGVVGMRDGVAVRISDIGGNPAEHIERLRSWHDREPLGNPSLQNALEMCRGSLFHAPSHGTREVLVVYGALLSSDPGDIHDTIDSLVTDRVRVSVVGLAAQVAICAELCLRTNAGDEGCYAVALHEYHLWELMLSHTTPPVTREVAQHQASLLMMGFPSRTLASKDHVSVCACHGRPTREGYLCTRCRSKVCRLPAECPGCGLTLILSTHLARSYHHLFPLRGWVEVSWTQAHRSAVCFSCLVPFPPVNKARAKQQSLNNAKQPLATGTENRAAGPGRAAPAVAKGVSESSRYACPLCGNHFCIDCDVFCHEVIHNCPGCQSQVRLKKADVKRDAASANGEKSAAPPQPQPLPPLAPLEGVTNRVSVIVEDRLNEGRNAKLNGDILVD